MPETNTRLKSRAAALSIAAFIAGWLLFHAKKGLFVYYSSDDIMNLYWAWTEPLGKLLAANVAPFISESYRPFGAAVYRLSLDVFGLHPLPLRILVYALLPLNAFLVFRLAKRLTGSLEIGVLAAFFMSYHRRLDDLYTNNGTMYDVVCATFYLLALLYYCRVREGSRRLRPMQFLALYCLFVAALNSKEIAATLPVMLLGYEIIYLRGPLRRLLFDCAAFWMTAIVGVLSIIRKLASTGHLANNPYYEIRLSAGQYFETTRKYFDNLFWQPDNTFNATGVMVVIALLLAIALLARSKHIWFLTAFILITPLPVNFIESRSLFAIYVTMIGWSIYAAAILVGVRDWLYARLWKRPPLPPDTWEPERVFLFLVVLLGLVNVEVRRPPIDWPPWRKSPIYQLSTDMRRLNPAPSRGARMLLLDDRFDPDSWTPALLVRMLYGDPELTLDRVKQMGHKPQGADLDKYTYVFDYRDNHLQVTR